MRQGCESLERKPRAPYVAALFYSAIFISPCYLYTQLPLDNPLHVLILALVMIITSVYGVVEPIYAYSTSKVNSELSLFAGKTGYRVPVLVKRGHCLPSPLPYSGCAIGFLPYLKFIALREEALEISSGDEIKALLAHETAHLKGNHMLHHVSIIMILFILSNFFSSSLPALIGWLLLMVSITLYLTRRFEAKAARAAINRVGAHNYAKAMRKLDETFYKERHTLVKWWYHFTHPDKKSIEANTCT